MVSYQIETFKLPEFTPPKSISLNVFSFRFALSAKKSENSDRTREWA